MADNPAPPPASRGPADAAPGKPQRQPTPVEHDSPMPVEQYGIVSVARHVKDDGRSLLLYTHRRPESS
jgi:hypothetical protein